MRLVIVPMAVVALAQTASFAGPKGDSWILLMGDNVTMSGSLGDVKRARAQRRGNEDLLFVRRGGTAYVVRDPQLVARAVGCFAPLHPLEKKMEGYDRVQKILSEQMEALSERMQDARTPEKQNLVATQMEALGREMERIGREQEKLGKAMEKVSQEAETKIAALVDEALRSGKALTVPSS
jgi:hypothetical protein